MAATNSTTEETLALVERVGAAFNRHDFDTVRTEMTEDIVAKRVASAGTGVGRRAGRAAAWAVFVGLPARFPNYRLETGGAFAAGNRCAYRWRLR